MVGSGGLSPRLKTSRSSSWPKTGWRPWSASMARRWCKATMPNKSSTNKALVHTNTRQIDGPWPPTFKPQIQWHQRTTVYCISAINYTRYISWKLLGWYLMASTIIRLKIEYRALLNHVRIMSRHIRWNIWKMHEMDNTLWHNTLLQKVMLVLWKYGNVKFVSTTNTPHLPTCSPHCFMWNPHSSKAGILGFPHRCPGLSKKRSSTALEVESVVDPVGLTLRARLQHPSCGLENRGINDWRWLDAFIL